MLYYAYLSLGMFLFSLLGTRALVLALRSRGLLMDRPNARSNHIAPVPRGGGIAVVFAMGIFLMVADASYLLVAGMLLLAAISLVDDWIKLSPITRLAVQFVVVLLVLPEATEPLLPGILPDAIDQGIRVLMWLWFINLFNFMDGIDGIAGAEMISIAFGILVLATLSGTFGDNVSVMALLAFAAGAGFLWWNWHPAKIFLGDVGSVPIGFLLGYILFALAKEGYVAAAWILPAYFITDATVTLARRAWRGEKVWQAHSEHAYQKAVRAGRSHDEVAKLVFGVNIILIFLAALTTIYPEMALFNVLLAYGVCAKLMRVFSQGRKSALSAPGK